MSSNNEQQHTVPQETKMCVKGCGFFGNAETGYMCSKCYKDTASAARASIEAPVKMIEKVETPKAPVPVLAETASQSEIITQKPVALEHENATVQNTAETPAESAPPKKKNRCGVCNKKVGLTALECRCQLVFCGLHRYPEQHNCNFDFKTHDRSNLEKVVVGGGEFSKIEHV